MNFEFCKKPIWRWCLGAWFALAVSRAFAADGDMPADFAHDILPILARRCHECHGPKKQEAGLRLDRQADAARGGDHGSPFNDFAPLGGLFWLRVSSPDAAERMPPEGDPLPPEELETLKRWIRAGAPWPEDVATPAPPTFDPTKHWSYRPLTAPAIPQVADKTWPRGDIDLFIRAQSEAAGVAHAAEASKADLARRLGFDLTGLPPPADEVDAFVADQSPDAYERLVDRLMASPAFGQRQARWWLDLVRYADSKDERSLNGPDDMFHAWRYRDYVVDSFNADRRYDEFLVEQLAGDILAEKDPVRRAELIVATGVLAIGNWGFGDSDKRKMISDTVDDQIDLVGRAWMGVTLACARCHDHKFDPFTREDYYALAGVFYSTRVVPEPGDPAAGTKMLEVSLESGQEQAAREAAAGEAAGLEAKLAERGRRLVDAMRSETLSTAPAYLAAIADYERLVRKGRAPTIDDFAREKKLRPKLFSAWRRQFGLSTAYDPDQGLLTERLVAFKGFKHVNGWGAADTPWALVNAANEETQVLTFRLPPKSVSIHPAPDRPAHVVWVSPIAGLVRIGGEINDGDAACGNGFRWRLEHRRGDRVTKLHEQGVANGGQRKIERAPGDPIPPIDLRVGDVLDLSVLPPGADHGCDTTVVDLKIVQQAKPNKRWELFADLLALEAPSNPAPDSYGTPNVWRFASPTQRQLEAPAPAPDGSLVKRWLDAVRKSSPAAAIAELEAKLVAAIQAKTPAGDDADESLKAIARDVTANDGAFWERLDPATFESDDDRALAVEQRTRLARLKSLASAIAPKANAAQEGGVPGSPWEGIADTKIHLRGRYDRLGAAVPRGVPKLIQGPEPIHIESGSGRLEVARWLTRPDHPLTARTIVNRIWQRHFGRGLAPSTGNLGALGEAPTHPALIDHLAVRFVESGWSLKELTREIVASATYRQASVAAHDGDPENRLWTRAQRRRLTAEETRDAMLVAADELDPTPGGPAVPAIDSRRRTLYVRTTRSDKSGFRPLFDAADSGEIVDQRAESTIAPQALFLMNNAFVAKRCENLAQRLVFGESAASDPIDAGFRRTLSRSPSKEERQFAQEWLGRDPDEHQWARLLQTLIWSNEFLFVD